MNLKKKMSVFSVLLLFITLIGCGSTTEENLYMVPHSISTKAYTNETKLNLYFVSDYKIEVVDDYGLDIIYGDSSKIDDFDFDKLTLVEKHQDYYIYQLPVDVNGVEGEVNIHQLYLNINGKDYFFQTNILISSKESKNNHIYSSTDEADIIIPGYRTYGLQYTLEAQYSMNITSIYFESLSGFDLNQNIDQIIVNDQPLNNQLSLLSEESFTFNITFDNIPNDIYIIDQLMVDYSDGDDQILQAYILAPLNLGSPVLASRNHIDYLKSLNENK